MLGAGYDSRAYRFAKLIHDTKIFELDIAPTQDRKKKCLKKANIGIPQQVTFVPINFNQGSLKNILEEAGYQSHKKTLFIWEGVSYYLDAESVDATLEFISHSSHKESTIAFDYSVSITEGSMNGYGVKKFAQTMKGENCD
ncbi:SAM-dependent methyltransferase [Thiotrichales bacterium HSG14]|nr:SAM-dependent methyltransferase [Thiotrichales bacterium HSG14]